MPPMDAPLGFLSSVPGPAGYRPPHRFILFFSPLSFGAPLPPPPAMHKNLSALGNCPGPGAGTPVCHHSKSSGSQNWPMGQDSREGGGKPRGGSGSGSGCPVPRCPLSCWRWWTTPVGCCTTSGASWSTASAPSCGPSCGTTSTSAPTSLPRRTVPKVHPCVCGFDACLRPEEEGKI